LRAESHALRQVIGGFATRREWLAAPDGPTLAARLSRHLSVVRRFTLAAPPAPRPRPGDWLHVVHWNVQHGESFDLLRRALEQEPALAGADLVSLNEADLGMARSGDRDVAFDLARELGMHAAWTPLFLELEAGYRADPALSARAAGESFLGLALLSRFPLGALRRVELPSPEDLLFDRERHVGRFVALVAEVLHPGAPLLAVVTHLDVHGTPAARLAQMQVVLRDLAAGPAVLMGDLNTTTFRRGSWTRAAGAFLTMAVAPRALLRDRFLRPHRPPGVAREPLFDTLRAHGFGVEPFNDTTTPSLDLRFDDVHELDFLSGPWRRLVLRILRRVERRVPMRLDWIVARDLWPAAERAPFTLPHLMREPGAASDHAPIGCGLRLGPFGGPAMSPAETPGPGEGRRDGSDAIGSA